MGHFYEKQVPLTYEAIIERMDKFRRFINEGHGDVGIKFYIAGIADAVVKPNVAAFAQKQGMYVIVQS